MPASVAVNGAKIEHLRKVRVGLTRRDAARVLGMSEVGLYYIERGRGEDKVSRTQPDTLQRIATFLRVDPEELAESEAKEVGDGFAKSSAKPVVASATQ